MRIGTFRNTADQIVAGQPQLVLRRLHNDVDLTKLDLGPFVDNEKIAPFNGNTTEERIRNLQRRIGQPNRIFYGLIDLRKPTWIQATLQGVLASEVPRRLDSILAGVNLVRTAPTTIAFFSVVSHTTIPRVSEILLNAAVEDVQHIHPGVTNFVTHSPIYKLRDFFLKLPEAPIRGLQLRHSYSVLREELKRVLGDNAAWKEFIGTPSFCADVRALSAYHVLSGRWDGPRFFSTCRAAGLHLGRGARFEEINIQSSSTKFGREESCGITATHAYSLDPEVTRKNILAYQRGTPARSPRMQELVGGSLPSPSDGLRMVPS